MPKGPDPKVQLTDAAFRLLAKRRWSDLTLAGVARAAKLPLASLQSIMPNKTALIGLMFSRLANETGRRYRPDSATDGVRDRLLDVCMTFFEIASTRKPAMRSLYDGIRSDPFVLLTARSEIVSAASWLLVLAEADTGAAPQVRALALAAIIARALPICLEDDREMSGTMARIDADFRRSKWLFEERVG
ncbi:MAG TPA: hypothetical protein VL286_05465 [Rhizomicrobium sp.]|jgi:AcrR family transcriptional regulator|nr:hypothetical protein [Rhizomicrobium sp.]